MGHLPPAPLARVPGVLSMSLRTLACLMSLVLLAPALPAQQMPKVGKEYKDEVDLGFSIKMPSDWPFVPGQPDDKNEIGGYSGGDMSVLMDPKTGRPFLELEIKLLKFDRRKASDGDTVEVEKDGEKIEINLGGGLPNFAAWSKNLKSGWKREEKLCKDLKVNKVETKLHVYRNVFDKKEDISAFLCAWEYKLQPDVEIVMLGFAPADDKRWGKWEGTLESMAKSFKPLEIASKKIAVAKGATMRDARRAELQTEITKNPGWKLYETPNYFLVSSKNDDKLFMKELMDRLEAIREQYEEIYPPALAAELRQLAKAREAAEEEEKKKNPEQGEGEAEPDEADFEKELARRTRASGGDPMERSKCSVVRVCSSEDEYLKYSGLYGSAGYWSFQTEELVLYDDQKGGGRANTWAVLNHEAFHQYVFYFFGNLSPHSWFNEGTGDFFSGFQLEGSRFKLEPFNWRIGTVKENIDPKNPAGKYAPLKELVRWSQAEYYGQNKYKLGGGENYAQGWSFIYFLRTGKKKAKDWNPAWETILDTYLRTLVETDDLDKAADKAFAGVDWDEMERVWKNYILGL